MRAAALAAILLCLVPIMALAHMPDRPDLNAWFSQLGSHKGMCCSFADGKSIADVDWDIETACENGKTGGDGIQSVPVCHTHYRVHLNGEWIVVPDNAVIEEPNKYGPAVVWPYESFEHTEIRCFMPGAGT